MADLDAMAGRLDKSYVAKGEPHKSEARTPRKPIPRGKRPRQVSDKQLERQAFLAGVKSERLHHQLLTEGFAQCELCPEAFDTFAKAKGGLDLHHTEKRSQGKGYRAGNMGVDAPRLLLLVCRSCHKELERNEPRWTQSA